MIYIFTGPIDSGKTNSIKQLVSNSGYRCPVSGSRRTTENGKRKTSIGGFLSLKVYENDQHIGYDLWEINSDRQLAFIRVQRPKTKDQKNYRDNIGKFYFNSETFEYSNKLIEQANQYDLFIVDELGPLELQGKGFWPALEKVFDCGTDFLFVIREGILDEFQKLFTKINKNVMTITDKEKLSSIFNIQ
ncbi:MAG: nucleoside-triphosphatase [bacterium]|nr:hypothetical protein [bacterium]MBU1918895.1 hypothetical protein [bacterium]